MQKPLEERPDLPAVYSFGCEGPTRVSGNSNMSKTKSRCGGAHIVARNARKPIDTDPPLRLETPGSVAVRVVAQRPDETPTVKQHGSDALPLSTEVRATIPGSRERLRNTRNKRKLRKAIWS